MKKVLFAFLVVLAFQTASYAGIDWEKSEVQSGLLFLDIPAVSMVHHNDNKTIWGFTGINTGFGISHRQYFEPLKAGKWNTSWEIGTIALIVPYIGIGMDYVWDNGWYLGIATFYILPYPRAGIFF